MYENRNTEIEEANKHTRATNMIFFVAELL